MFVFHWGFVSVIVFRLVCITYKDSIVVYFIGLCDIARLILILYYIASIFKTIIDTIFVYSFRYNIKIVMSIM